MKIIKINEKKPERNKIQIAWDILRNGGTIVYPTDTVYGLGVNIHDMNAVKEVFKIKKRPFSKPLSVCVSRVNDINKVAYLNENQLEIVNKVLPGPYTIILRKKEHVSSLLTAGSNKIGVRIPNNKICMELSKLFPITTTSANLSGIKAPSSVNEVVKQLNNLVDLILDGGTSKNNPPSTIIDLTSDNPEIVRESIYKFE